MPSALSVHRDAPMRTITFCSKFMSNIVGSDNIDSSAAFGYAKVQKAWILLLARQPSHTSEISAWQRGCPGH